MPAVPVTINASQWEAAEKAASEKHSLLCLPSAPSIPDVSVIIPIHNQLGITLDCLASIIGSKCRATYEVIVVDDSSSVETFWHLKQIENLKVIRNFSNLGFVLGCNRGAKEAKGMYVVFLNNDTLVPGGWLDTLIRTFATFPRVGLVGPMLVYPDGTLQEAGGICWRDGSAWNFGRNDDPEKPEYGFARETDYISGACIMLPRELWEKLDGFDPIYAPAYYEDTDLAFRVRQHGYQVIYQPACRVVHLEGKSNGTDVTSGLKSYQVRNQQTFLARWGVTLESHYPNGERVFRARERAFDKKIILFIDHYVPREDKDAGSRSVLGYIRLLVKWGYSVKFVGDNFARWEPYTSNLQAIGVEVIYGPQMVNGWQEWLAKIGAEIDYVILSRAHIALRWIAPLRACTRAPLLFLGHDWISRTLKRAARDFNDAKLLRESRDYQIFEEGVLPNVDWIFYPSDIEVSELTAAYPNKRVMRLPLMSFSINGNNSFGFAQRSNLLFVGGFGHAPNRDAAVWFCREVMPKLQEIAPRLHLTIAGAFPTPDVLALESEAVSVYANVSDGQLAELYRTHRVVVVPLRIGGGIKGKVLEAMAQGVPVVTTPIGSEGLDFSSEVMEIAATDAGEFADAVIQVYNNQERWHEIQRRALEFIRTNYSENAIRSALSPVLVELLSAR
ncbi:glycosyltransferase [Nibricoccus sp. IMCC34717]|uniref:glycosyltransferase n=1 Tax=Nibricoccus sp. IMCC34717 TaxID=3034021 RepID=UPI00384D0709